MTPAEATRLAEELLAIVGREWRGKIVPG